ncbi:MAG: polyphenol oxidase family protein [Oligoflexales bacterium]|nr:polyphenol oxidase family protein [Oligoflexales bacterium]
MMIDTLNRIHIASAKEHLQRGFPGFLVRVFGKENLSNLDQTSVPFLRQVHSNKVINADANLSFPIEADGVFSKRASSRLSILTADCLPILVGSDNCALALHAGWRGLFGGIVSSGLAEINFKPSTSSAHTNLARNNFAFIGPAICAQHYEVDEELIETLLLEKNLRCSREARLFACQKSFGGLASSAKTRARKWQLDLRLLAVFELLEQGFAPEAIYLSQDCTYCDADLWHSYRRDGANSGRNISRIELLSPVD